MSAVHRPGPYKQQNKAHKHGKHRSNRSIDIANKGRVSVKTATKKSKHELKRHDRRNQIQQLRKKKRDDVLARKRSLGVQGTPPFLVLIIVLSPTEDPSTLVKMIKNCDEEAIITSSQQGYFHISIPRFKQRFTFVVTKPGDLYSILDAAKVADTLLLIHGLDDDDSGISEQILSMLFAQGLPATVHTVQGLEKVPIKKRSEIKKNKVKLLEKRFPDEKLHVIEQPQDALLLLRQISCQKKRNITFRNRRSHLLAEELHFEPHHKSTDNASLNDLKGTLKISGYIRGQPLDVNGLVHISGWGDFQMAQIEGISDPHPMQYRKRTKTGDIDMEGDLQKAEILDVADASIQEELQSENIPDPLEGEQTWPTEEELAEAEENKVKRRKKVPKGTSAYQAAWIIESDEEDKDDEFDDEEGVPKVAKELDISCEMDVPMDEREENNQEEVTTQDGDDDDESDVTSDVADEENYDQNMNIEEEDAMLKKYKEEKMDRIFPDEVDTPLDTPAKVRFGRYRGLKSFATSPWDPMENLPLNYGRIFQFENFGRTKKRVLAEGKEGILPGRYITVHILDVPQQLYDNYDKCHPVVLFEILPHEQKMTVVNIVLKKHPTCSVPIKSKDRLIFHVGYRRFEANPIYSAHTNANKHKYEKFLRSDMPVVATVFAPIIFPPAPVLAFQFESNEPPMLIATGSVLSVNPNRVVVKRIVLSGHPFKINKRSAVVRYMFFNRDDINWFKPVELCTKLGRRGHIREPLGSHGHMKCVFDKTLKAQDVVLMNLYKRIYPKWTYQNNTTYPFPLFDPSLYDTEMK